MTTPWRIAAQSFVVLDPDTKEPAFTLSFDVDHGQADQVKLRMQSLDGSALEFTFSTGGYVMGEPVRIEKKKAPGVDGSTDADAVAGVDKPVEKTDTASVG